MAAAPIVASAEPAYVFADSDRRAKLTAAFPAIDTAIADEMATQNVPGLALGIVIDGDLAYARGYGVTDIDTKAVPDADTVYRIGSITKSFTGLVLLSLRDEGALRLDDPLVRYVPEASGLVYPTSDARPITLRQLATHTSGLRPGGTYPVEDDPDEATIVKSLDHLALDAAPGTMHSYSNLGYSLLGIVESHAAHVPYHELVEKRIWEPLGMTSTFWAAADVPANRLATTYASQPGPPKRADKVARLGAGDGAGGIYSTVRDMARYAVFQLAAYPPRDAADSAAIPRSTVREAHSTGVDAVASLDIRVAPKPGDHELEYFAATYGFGWYHMHTCDDDDLVRHSGGIESYRSELAVLTTKGVGMVVLTNFPNANAFRFAQRALAELRRTKALVPRVGQMSPDLVTAMQKLLAIYNRWDAAAFKAILDPSRPPGAVEQAELAGYAALHGKCSAATPRSADSATRGTFELTCERGNFEMSINLRSGGIGGFSGTSKDITPPPAIARLGADAAALTRTWDDRVFARSLAVTQQPRAVAKAYFDDLRAAHGACKVSTAGHSVFDWSFDLACERGGGMTLVLTMAEPPANVLARYGFGPQTGARCPVR